MKKSGKWDIEITKNILSYYQSENPLTHAEWQVVKMDIMFPHLFIGAMNKYYYQRDVEWSPQKYLQRLKEMSGFEKSITPVLGNFETLIRF
jgi:spore coat-associated protein S